MYLIFFLCVCVKETVKRETFPTLVFTIIGEGGRNVAHLISTALLFFLLLSRLIWLIRHITSGGIELCKKNSTPVSVFLFVLLYTASPLHLRGTFV